LQRLLQLSRAIDTFNNWIGRLTLWIVPLMVLVGAWNVIGRYLGRSLGVTLSSNAWLEAQWYLFDLVFLLGAAYALLHNEHVRVDVLYTRWSSRRQALVNLIGTLLFLIPFCLMVILFSWEAIASSWAILEASPDPEGLPRYPIKSMLVVSFVLLILQGISEAIKHGAILTGHLDPTPLEETHDTGL